MLLISCWISSDAALPGVLQTLDDAGWQIRARKSVRGLPDDIQVLFCDPEWSGLQKLCEARNYDDGPPPIIIIGDIDSEERGEWIAMGADDVISDNCSTAELTARAKTHFDKSVLTAREWQYGYFTFHLFERLVFYAGNLMELNGREYMLLLYLARAQARVVSKTELLRKIWGLDFDPGTNRIEVYIFRLRAKLQEFGGRALLKTHKGKGYSLRSE